MTEDDWHSVFRTGPYETTEEEENNIEIERLKLKIYELERGVGKYL